MVGQHPIRIVAEATDDPMTPEVTWVAEDDPTIYGVAARRTKVGTVLLADVAFGEHGFELTDILGVVHTGLDFAPPIPGEPAQTAIADIATIADGLQLSFDEVPRMLGLDRFEEFASLRTPTALVRLTLGATRIVVEFLAERVEPAGMAEMVHAPAPAFGGATLYEVLADWQAHNALEVYRAVFELRYPDEPVRVRRSMDVPVFT